MRGEQPGTSSRNGANTGSPPHARGTAKDRFIAALFIRITPACAGNSLSDRPPSFVWRDHPRMRGEQCRGNP